MKQIARKIPGILFLYHKYVAFQLKSKSTEDVFTNIYKRNTWGGEDSVSGPGSDNHQTSVITRELPTLFNEFNISSILDIPCGDFHWMKNVNLKGIDYTGADIVKDLMQRNRERYERDGVCFHDLNLIDGKLPKVDLVFCRDCLVHLSFADIFLALKNICDSNSEYLLTTTFTSRKDNYDIVTGQWRVLNLELAPFILPNPLKIINEECTEADAGGVYEDKALGLWRIKNILESLTMRCT